MYPYLHGSKVIYLSFIKGWPQRQQSEVSIYSSLGDRQNNKKSSP